MTPWKGWIIFGTVSIMLLVVLPLLNALPNDSTFWLPDFYLNLLGKYLSLAIMGMGLGVLWGYAGILSLGQAVFFGLGGYSMGMHLMLQISGQQSKYGEAVPDFMVWNQVKELPFFWVPYHSFAFALASAVFLPVLFALLFGYLTFRSRIQGVYVAILTQALAFAAWLLFNRNEMRLGGTNGLTDYKTLLGFSLLSPTTQRGLYIITAVCLLVTYGLCLWLTRGKLGHIFRAIRDGENRLRFLGYSPTGFKMFVFALAAGLAGLAGALYVPQVGIITPSQMGVMPSLEVVVWVAVGGREALIGGPLGAVLINGLRSYLTTVAPQLWPFVLGALFVGVVLLFPSGVVGLPKQFERFMHRSSSRWRSGGRRSPLSAATASGSSENPDKLSLDEEEVKASEGSLSAGAGAVAQHLFGSRVEDNGANKAKDGETTKQADKREEPLLRVENVTVSFEGFLALRNLNFSLMDGELRFVIGPNGAGKTTMLDVICGKVKPIQGKVIFGQSTNLLALQEHEVANIGVGRKFQTPTVFPYHTVLDNLQLSWKTRKTVGATLAALQVRQSQQSRDRLLEILEFVGLGHHTQTFAGVLSHGQRQWLEIAMLLAQEPELLLVDEPVAGMTGRERDKTGLLLEAIAREHATVLVIEHDMEFVRHFSNTVTVLHEGSLLCEGKMQEVQNDPRVLEVYLGREEEERAANC
ncbi:MAG TPA: urea ABC transporter permease subunit UrtC [Nitrospiraceae bacterium]|jgi:urea transport system permease protein|nr:urea ABC transporter permease subunit UrtC [Nitrospiraceae bacterium]